jgi:hypothetical protein
MRRLGMLLAGLLLALATAFVVAAPTHAIDNSCGEAIDPGPGTFAR